MILLLTNPRSLSRIPNIFCASGFSPASSHHILEFSHGVVFRGVPAHDEGREMSEDMSGVFFRDQEVEEYLVEVYEDEEEAQEAARVRDQRVFEQVMEEGEGDAPTWEDYDGMHYVEPIARTFVEEVQDQLDRGFAVRV